MTLRRPSGKITQRLPSLIDLISDLVAIGRDRIHRKDIDGGEKRADPPALHLRRIDREDRPARQEGGDERRVEKGHVIGDDDDPIPGGRDILEPDDLDPVGEAEQHAGQHPQHVLRQQFADPHRDERVGDRRGSRTVPGVSSPAAISPAVTAAAPAMNSALTTLLAAMMRARDASSLRLWIIA